MSKFEISKARLAEIIKEEYQILQEDNALERTIARWADEARAIPRHLTVARMIEDGDFDGALEAVEDMKQDAVAAAMEATDGHGMSERLHPDQLEIDEVEIGKQKERQLGEAHCTPGTRDDKKGKYDDGDNNDETCDYVDCENEDPPKKMKKESVDAIRQLIKQELRKA